MKTEKQSARRKWCEKDRDGLPLSQYATALNVAGAALFGLYARADLDNRYTLIRQIVKRAKAYAIEVEGWPEEEASVLVNNLANSF